MNAQSTAKGAASVVSLEIDRVGAIVDDNCANDADPPPNKKDVAVRDKAGAEEPSKKAVNRVSAKADAKVKVAVVAPPLSKLKPLPVEAD